MLRVLFRGSKGQYYSTVGARTETVMNAEDQAQQDLVLP